MLEYEDWGLCAVPERTADRGGEALSPPAHPQDPGSRAASPDTGLTSNLVDSGELL